MYVRIVADDSIPSLAIRGTLHAMFSHVGFKLDDETWLDCRWSMGKSDGVQIRPADSVKETRHLDFTFEGINQAVAYGKALIGTPYDLSNIAGFVFDPAIHNPHELICSRFVRLCSTLGRKMKGLRPLLNASIADWHIAPHHFSFCVGTQPDIIELDRWPRDLTL